MAWLEIGSRLASLSLVGGRHRARRDARHLGDHVLDQRRADLDGPVGLGHQPDPGPGLVHDVDRLVGQVRAVDVPGRQLGGGGDRGVGVA
jgi:hypothetical protein